MSLKIFNPTGGGGAAFDPTTQDEFVELKDVEGPLSPNRLLQVNGLGTKIKLSDLQFNPLLSHKDDPTTGLDWSGSGLLRVLTSGVEAMRIDSGQRFLFGIGGNRQSWLPLGFTDADQRVVLAHGSAGTLYQLVGVGGNQHVRLSFTNARGTLASPSDIQVGDTLGGVQWHGRAGALFREAAGIDVEAIGIVGTAIDGLMKFRVQRADLTTREILNLSSTGAAVRVMTGSTTEASIAGISDPDTGLVWGLVPDEIDVLCGAPTVGARFRASQFWARPGANTSVGPCSGNTPQLAVGTNGTSGIGMFNGSPVLISSGQLVLFFNPDGSMGDAGCGSMIGLVGHSTNLVNMAGSARLVYSSRTGVSRSGLGFYAEGIDGAFLADNGRVGLKLVINSGGPSVNKGQLTLNPDGGAVTPQGVDLAVLADASGPVGAAFSLLFVDSQSGQTRLRELLLVRGENTSSKGRRSLPSGDLTTTDATVTTLQTVALADGRTYLVHADVVVRSTDATKHAVYYLAALVKVEAGVATIGTAGVSPIFVDEDGTPALDATLTVSGQNLLVRVTGLAATTMRWGATTHLQEAA